MNRGELITGMSAGGYSLIVLADDRPLERGTTAAGREIAERSTNTTTPAAPLASPERNMALTQLSCDVLVAGGGLAGVCAALAAARHGASVVLVQDRSRLGGNSSSEVKMHVVGANYHKDRPGWREGGILEELRLDDATRNPQNCFELWDLLLYEKIVAEPNIKLLLDSTLYSASVGAGHIESVMVRCDRSESLYCIRANIFIDCTGDSRLGMESGAEMRCGREARAEFNESLAPEKPDALTMGSSILFTSRLHDRAMPFIAPAWARKVTKEQVRFRSTDAWEYGYWWIEWGGSRHTIRDHERIRLELLSIVMGVWNYIKNSGNHPESANWALDWVGMLPGRRESRRIVGDHILKQQDLEDGNCADAIAIGGWPMDDHPPGGFDSADLAPAQMIRLKEVYNIPLRCLCSRNIANLMMAGRNISATHVAFSSTRVMATCAVLGQAAGTATAMCVRIKATPRQLASSPQCVRELQQTLLRDDQTIRGLKNEDPRDLARNAEVRASGARDNAPARNIIDGEVRDIPCGPVHRWSAPLVDAKAWIALSWPQPQEIGHVQITFDSGFQRELTLSAKRAINDGIVRGPQPEMVRDYTLLYRAPGSEEWKTLTEVKGNVQRLCRHSFPAVRAEAIRVQITAMNGCSDAHVFEVRCYGQA